MIHVWDRHLLYAGGQKKGYKMYNFFCNRTVAIFQVASLPVAKWFPIGISMKALRAFSLTKSYFQTMVSSSKTFNTSLALILNQSNIIFVQM